MHIDSLIYFTNDLNLYSLLMWISLIGMMLGIFRKKSFTLLLAVIVAGVAFYKIKYDLACSFSIFGMDLMLISCLAYFGHRTKNFAPQIAYIFFASLCFLFVHPSLTNILTAYHNHSDNNIQLDNNGELLVKFENQEDLKLWMNKNADQYDIIYPAFTPVDKSYSLDEYVLVNIKDNQNVDTLIDQIENHDLVTYVEGNELLELKLPAGSPFTPSNLSLSVNDPHSNKQWMAREFDLDKFHKDLQKASAQKQTTIAILDTGIDSQHEDLIDNYISTSQAYDSDDRGHGTHCAGIAAAVSGNNIGIASWIPQGLPIKVTSIKVMGRLGVGSQRTIINGILKAADSGYDVISMSLGGKSNPAREKAYREAVKYANEKGAIVVVAAGNSSMDARGYSPANTKGVIVVSALNSELQLAEFSNTVYGLPYGIAAPGKDIYSTLPNSLYGLQSGTSMAAPFVSGILGLMKYYNPQLTTKEAYSILKKSALNKNGQLIINPIDALSATMSQEVSE